MSPEVTVELIRSIFWLLLIAILILIFRGPIIREILPRIGGVKAFGIEVTLIQVELENAAKKQKVVVSGSQLSNVLRRAQRVAPIIQEAQILWVDDNPEGNISERKILRSLGIFIDLAKTSTEALSMIPQTDYDAIISDMWRRERRPDGQEIDIPDAGQKFLAEMMNQKLQISRWTIFYAAGFDPGRGVPPYAFGMTNRPDELIHLVLDILERKRS